jgi:hypothetical protein
MSTAAPDAGKARCGSSRSERVATSNPTSERKAA